MAESDPNSPKAPHLPGIVPRGGDPEPIPEVSNPLVRLAVQFFAIPMAIVIFCVALVFLFRWLTWEKRDLDSYLDAVQSSIRSASQKEQEAMKLLNYIQEAKRWQSIYDVTEQLRFNREEFLRENPDFPARVARVFREAGPDRRVRQYLAQVLGLVGGPEVVPELTAALKDSDSETVIYAMIALGRIGEPSAIPDLIEASYSSDRGIRQTAVFVLGSFEDDSKAIERSAEALNDPDVLVQWNAAFSLGRAGDPRALPVLKYFLDEDYVSQATAQYARTTGAGETQLATFHPDRLEQYRATAIRLLGEYPEESLQKELQIVAKNDKQLKVRQAAIEVLRRFEGPGEDSLNGVLKNSGT
jgi:HEAT repeat protein